MIKLFINNIPVQVPVNTTILEACAKIGIMIPRFCYHENLNVAGNCRMCLIEVENLPKPVAACAYPSINQLKIFTNTPLVKKARENILEFLLINHPLDCPICDQGGECDLQEQTLLFGSNKSRFFFEKRTVEDINCSPLIKLIMTRCIHCTRCVRFFQEICNTEKLGTLGRGNKTEINLFTNTALNSEFSGNIIDLCPVGALTSKSYAFATRPWELVSHQTIDPTDALGSTIKVNLKGNEIIRILPLKNSENTQWINDKTRFFFDGLKINSLINPYQYYNNKFYHIKWNRILKIFINLIFKMQSSNSLSNLIIISNNLNLESLETLKRFSYFFKLNILSESLYKNITNINSFNNNNIKLEDLINTDLLLFVGLNPRIECSLYNLKIKKTKKIKNKFIVATIGLSENLLYKNIYLGNSLTTFINILNGKHTFCKNLVQTKNPVIIVGSKLQNRIDFDNIQKSFYFLFKYNNSFKYGLMNSDLNETGVKSLITNNINIDLNKVKFLFIFGDIHLNTILKKLPNLKHIFIQKTNMTNITKSIIKMYLPTTLFFETEGHYLNYNNKIVKSSKIINPLKNIKSINSLTTTLLSLLNVNLINFNLKNYTNNSLVENFDAKLIKNQYIYTNNKKKYCISVFKTKNSNIFQSNVASYNSINLAKMVIEYKKNYINYI